MIYVFSHYKSIKEDKIKNLNIDRLFAYPIEPIINNNVLTILDSGGFAMSIQNKKITTPYMIKLSQYYEKYDNENVICVAPDKWLDSAETIRLYQKWQKLELYKNIVPVLQDKKKGVVDVEYMKRQVDFYKNKSQKLMYSNNGIYGDSQMAIRIEQVCKYAKEEGFKWIHLLGAGWSLEDIKSWQKIRYIDSMDSIAYYKSYREFESNSPFEAMNNILKLFR